MACGDKKLTRMLCGIALVSALSGAVWAQTMTKAQQEQIANKVIAELREKYPFPDLEQKMEAKLKDNLKAGVYAPLTNPADFAGRLTQDLQEISRDRHVSLHYSPEKLEVKPIHLKTMYSSAEELKQMQEDMRSSNYGTTELRILDGNIGYIRFDMLAPPEIAAETYAAAMRYVANTDALILDLRQCGGARSPDTIPFLTGYFFEHPVHLTDFYLGNTKTPRQIWSSEHVPGPTYYNKPVFMVTSHGTFSGCEAIAYEMQAYKRVKVVGEVTGGGGNPNAMYPIDEHFVLSTAVARGVNPVTGSNWEDKGVQPDIAASRSEGLYVAQRVALETLMASASHDQKQMYADKLEDLRNSPPRLERVTFKLPGHQDAKKVSVLGTFNSFVPWANPMKYSNGEWSTEVQIEPGNHVYLFLVDGAEVLDPANPKLNRDKRANLLQVR